MQLGSSIFLRRPPEWIRHKIVGASPIPGNHTISFKANVYPHRLVVAFIVVVAGASYARNSQLILMYDTNNRCKILEVESDK